MKRLRSRGGFTLIELLIVIIIIGILAAIAIPMFLGQRDRAKEASVREGIHSIQIGVQSYAVGTNDEYPSTAQMTGTTAAAPSAMGTYLDIWPKNAWAGTTFMFNNGTPNKGDYRYVSGDTATFSLVGYGKTNNVIVTVP